ncbi:hypothetical protein LCGC14_1165580 [marine sediment metagenome]|uniref:Uncharacterized protein n=1 Tax=marine sediment metagenome TaxID=412755 RepID=A0A0F9P9I2_9ZZZZ
MSTGIDAKLTLDSDNIWTMTLTEDGDIETEDAFETYIIVALFTDIRADGSEVATSENRRGWIGNEETPGFEMGSKLWLLDQADVTPANVNLSEEYALQALSKMVEEELALSVRVDSSGTHEGIQIAVEIIRPDSSVFLRYFNLWENTGK